MEVAKLDTVQLEYEIKGIGEPVLLINPVVAGAFVPFLAAPALSGFRLIRYHKRGWAGSTHSGLPVSIGDHAADAARLLEHLGVRQAHVVGHSSSAAITMQLAADRPDLVHSLGLLEPSLLDLPSAAGLFERAGPFLEAYDAGDHEKAVTGFLSVVSGLDEETCRQVIDRHVPGGVAQAIADADTFFGIELPSLMAWKFSPLQAAGISQPVLSLRGRATEQLWVDVATVLRSWFPHAEEHIVEGVGHLLQMQHPEPVAHAVAAFLRRHPMRGV
jgi:pimeloyl-ACP methyl ester carboxylesterase